MPVTDRLIIDPTIPPDARAAVAASGSAPSGNAAPIRIDPANADADDRFHRFRLIGWWDQEKLRAAKVLVVGAGALGNEIIKNLALLGVGNVLIADLDRIENSNLSRSALYRASDNGKYKADVAAASARDIYPDARTHAFVGNVVYDLGLGVFRWADVVIGGLDNREARLAINRACWRVGRPWIDGAIEQINGTARVFVPDPAQEAPCYECTMSETDWKLLQFRRSCNLLTRAEMETGGRTPTTPTVSAIIAGVQCQEAVKLIHGMETIGGKGWVFNGLSTDSYQVDFQRKETCYSHEPLEDVISLDSSAETMTVRSLLDEARRRLGPAAVIEFGRDILEKLSCPKCKAEELMYTSLGKVRAEKAVCPDCGGDTRRDVVTFYKIRGDEPASLLSRTLAGIGVPPFDIVIARGADGRVIGLELSADAAAVLGPEIAPAGGEELEWA